MVPVVPVAVAVPVAVQVAWSAPPRRKGRRRRNREELQPMDVPSYTPVDAPVPEGEVVVERASTALDLGPKLNRTAADVVRFLMQAGEMVTATQSLSDDMIELFAAEIEPRSVWSIRARSRRSNSRSCSSSTTSQATTLLGRR